MTILEEHQYKKETIKQTENEKIRNTVKVNINIVHKIST